MKILLSFILLVTSLNCSAEWFKKSEGIMGTNIEVELWSDSKELADTCIGKVMDEMRRIDRTMSPYIETSELSQINQFAAKRNVKISQELFGLIQQAQRLSKLSGGAFDITFASIGYQYDYRKKIKPSDKQIREQLDRINYRHIEMNSENQTIHFKKEGVRIDLGGIAKGHAVDNSIDLLQECGIRDALVTAGGDTRIIGDHHGRPWMTGIKDPRKENRSIIAIPLDNTAVSTSGDYERFFIKDGVRYHHILSPKTGKSVHSTQSVTVLGPDATTTDGLSTTIFILGPEKGLALAEKLDGIDVVIIDAAGKVHYSSGLMPPSQMKTDRNTP